METKQFSFSKLFFERLYVLPIIIFGIIFFINFRGSSPSKEDLLSYIETLPAEYTATQAIQDGHLIVNQGVITNITYVYNFFNSCKEKSTSQLVYVNYDKEGKPIIKTAFYKRGKIYVNLDDSRTSNGKKEIQQYVFTDINKVDDENTLSLTLFNDVEKIDFFKYNKKTGEGI